jgi:ATP-dependent Clp protease ATP-binding subunit ClpA
LVLRLDPALAELLAAVAEVEGRTVSDVAREAIAALVEARRQDKRFQRLLEDNLARQEARRLGHDRPPSDPEHILLGLIGEGHGVAVKALQRLGISPEAVRQQVEQTVGQGRPQARRDRRSGPLDAVSALPDLSRRPWASWIV